MLVCRVYTLRVAVLGGSGLGAAMCKHCFGVVDVFVRGKHAAGGNVVVMFRVCHFEVIPLISMVRYHHVWHLCHYVNESVIYTYNYI